MKYLFFISFILVSTCLCAQQYKGIPMDSAAIKAWATSCTLKRGWLNIADTTLGKVTFGSDTSAIAKADGVDVVSLGDGGEAIVTFASPITNGSGYDFAIFENSFISQDLLFMELAFVEVSSDGVHFFRFSASSMLDTSSQTVSFGTSNPQLVSNLAGNCKATYGTPFDLEELKNIPGLDVTKVTHVKLIDVVGSLNNSYCTRDKNGRKINDPWPTAFPSGGFDLDAVAVINQLNTAIEQKQKELIQIYPTLISDDQLVTFYNQNGLQLNITVVDISGQIVLSQKLMGTILTIDLSVLQKGMYGVSIENEHTKQMQKIVKL